MKKKTTQKDRVADAATPTARWRKMLGINQDEAASMLGVSKRTVQFWEDPDSSASPGYAQRVIMAMYRDKIPIPAPIPEK